jgi:type VI protein secretion system component Hcp
MTMTTEQTKRNELSTDQRNALSDEQLAAVTGGDLHITKVVDKSSPSLFTACCTGQHFK